MTPRRVYAPDYALRIGRRATLVSSVGDRAYGMVFALTQRELERLYSAPGLEEYRAETIDVVTFDAVQFRVLCYNLPAPPPVDEGNAEYAARLRAVLTKLEFPSDYVASVAESPTGNNALGRTRDR